MGHRELHAASPRAAIFLPLYFSAFLFVPAEGRALLIKRLTTSLVASLLLFQPLRADEPNAVAQPLVARGQKKLLVIFPELFHKTLHKFIEHKQKHVPTELVSLEAVVRDTAGCDDPERVKRFLYEQWTEHNAAYALLDRKSVV